MNGLTIAVDGLELMPLIGKFVDPSVYTMFQGAVPVKVNVSVVDPPKQLTPLPLSAAVAKGVTTTLTGEPKLAPGHALPSVKLNIE